MITWQLRVAGALLLAYFFSISNGSTFWSATLPTLLGVGALSTAGVVLALRRRRGIARGPH